MNQVRENLFLQFSIVSFVALVIIAFVLNASIASAVRSHAEAALASEAVAMASNHLVARITLADLETPMTGDRYDRFDAFVKTSILSGNTARVKVWAKDGTIIYSDSREAVGKKFPTNERMLRALNGETIAEIEKPESEETETEASLGVLMSVYTPIVFADISEAKGVFEIYQYYEPTGQLIAKLHRWASLSISAGFLLLYGALVGIVWRGWRTIKRQQAALVTSDRLASIGELVSGVAHEINNPLTSVIGFSQLLLEKDVSPDIKSDLQVVHDEAQRTGRIVKNLLSFARQQAPIKQLTNVNSVIERVLALRAYEQKVNNIQVNAQLAPGLPEIMADPSQLQQVFFNLVINAEHFMLKAHKRGTLTILTEKSGRTVRVTFTDDGPGIPKEHMKRLFTPFFTTKEVGKGTGLGLSICYGIITRHGGRIYAESEPGKGATFIVELPITQQLK
ncbi:MAG: hypothetical protein HY670_01985 [Chloroflexi bacterium]|nr:hypothetical protein [Chloroflexota bacterium]